MCLTCRVPKEEELLGLDPFDLAFLTITGHVRWVDPFDYAFKVMKAAKAHDSKIILWGPEAEMLFRAVENEFEKTLLPTINKIIKCFDLSGDVTVDAARARALNAKLREMGNEFADSLQTPAATVIETILVNAEKHFLAQKETATKQLTEAGWREYLAEANGKHLDEFLRKFPEDRLHPQIEKLIVLGETSASRRLIDRGVLTERIGRLGDSARMSLSEMTDVEAGLAWTGTGLGLASSQGVTHYVIQAEEDKRTCPVCMRLNGRKVSVEGAIGVFESVMGGHRRHHFPRVPEIDNVSPDEVEGMNLFPPFHPRCRCDLGFLWRETVSTPRPHRVGPQSLQQVPIRPRSLTSTGVELLPTHYSELTSASELADLRVALMGEGKVDAAVAVKKYKPGKHTVAIKYGDDGTVEAFAQMRMSAADPRKFRILDMHGFGADWESSRYALLQDIANHAIDKGRTFVQVVDIGFDNKKMRRFGFKKSGKFYTIEDDRLVQFGRLPLTSPRPIPPPPPPPVTVAPVPTATPPVSTAFSDLELVRTGDWGKGDLQLRKDIIDYFLRDQPDKFGGRLHQLVFDSLDHIDTLDLKRMADRDLRLLVDRSGKEGVFFGFGHGNYSTPVVSIGDALSRKTISHEFGHAYDFFNGDRKYLQWKKTEGFRAFGKLDEDDAKLFNRWWSNYTKDAPRVTTSGGFELRKAKWVDDYEGRLYPDTPDGVEWWSVNSARYSHYVQEARKVEKEIYDTIRKYSVNGIKESEIKSLPLNVQRWVKGEIQLSDLITDATKASKWQKGVDLYGEEVTNLIKKAYNYKPMDLSIAERMKPLIVKPPPAPVVPISGKVPLKVPAAWRDAVLGEHRDAILHYSARHGITVDEAIQRLSDHVRELAQNSSTWIRRQTRLQSILEDGRFKTQFETQTSSGLKNNAARARFERDAGGYPLDLDREDRMVYGYISDDPDGMLGHRMNVDQYGEIAFKLKRQVRQRATFTLGDSLGNHSVSWDRVDEGSHYAIDHGFIRDFFTDGPRRKLNLKATGELDSRYWEAQYHWGLSVDDIEEVIIPINTGFGSTEAEVRRHFRRAIELLEQKNIPYRFLDRSSARWGGTY
jgi:hypothetical protein